jgi:hypothetical protein
VWAKPLESPGVVAVVLFNRAGLAVGSQPPGNSPLPPFCTNSASSNYPCVGCFVDDDKPWLAPCDDNATASAGAQEVSLDFARLPGAWLGLADNGTISCDIFDVFASAARGAALGRFSGGWRATVPPHGVRFLRVSGCKVDDKPSGPSSHIVLNPLDYRKHFVEGWPVRTHRPRTR